MNNRVGAARPVRATMMTAIAAFAAIGVAACGSGNQAHSAAASSASVTTQAANVSASSTTRSTSATSVSSAATPPAPQSAKLTAPGAHLKPGATAIVKYDTTLDNGKDGPSWKLALTVESIHAGSLSDFKGITLSGVPANSVPTYVKLRMTNLGPKAMDTGSNDPAVSVQAIRKNGQEDNNLILTGFFPPCPDADTPNPLAVGQTFTTCETYMESGEATMIGYNGSSSTLDSPIIWSP